MVMERVTGDNLSAAIREHVEVGSIVCTDDYMPYRRMPKIFTHKSVKHGRKEYAGCEGDFVVSFSLLKRGVIGRFTKSARSIYPYLAEFDHRYNYRKVTDGERTVSALGVAEGKRLPLKPLKKGV